MGGKPFISIGIPTYNKPEGLRKTLECITRQTYNNLEIIISDNCSTNSDVGKVVNEYLRNDKRIKFYRQKKNIGAVSNFKFVLDKSTGKYFMWAADDDWRHPSAVEKMFSCIDQSKMPVHLIMSDVNLYNENGMFIRTISYDESYSRFHNNPLAFANFIISMSENNKYNIFIYGLFESETLKQIFLGFPEVVAADRLMIAYYVLRYNVKYTNEALYNRVVAARSFYDRYTDDPLSKKYYNDMMCKTSYREYKRFISDSDLRNYYSQTIIKSHLQSLSDYLGLSSIKRWIYIYQELFVKISKVKQILIKIKGVN